MRLFLKLPFKKFGFYLVGGGLSFLLKITLTIFLTEFIGISYFFSYVITLICIVFFGFFYNAYLTFKVGKGKLRNFFLYMFVLLTFTVIDASLVKILTESFYVYYVVSIITVTTLIFIAKFFVYDRFVFVAREVRSI